MDKNHRQELVYAKNAEGKIVCVDKVPTGIECQCTCIACNEPLIAKNKGLKRIHHFAHKSGIECEHAVESMLHLLAKERIQKAFLSKSEFWIEFEYKSFCHKNDKCDFFHYKSECYESEIKKINLKDYYDSCEQEVSYDNIIRRSDLKIFSSTKPDRKPIYLEFCVTHASDSEKLHSGNKIIEIFIESENDITQLEKGIEETDYYNGRETTLPKTNFYGFKQKDYTNHIISTQIEFVRYILYKSGKTQCYQDYCNCKDLSKSKTFSLLEICIHTCTSFGIYDKVKYIGYQQFGIRNCCICSNYVDNNYRLNKICRLYKHLQISLEENLDTSRAKDCQYFKLNEEEMKNILKNGLEEKYSIFK